MQFKIFVSYSTKDLEQVELLKQKLSDSPVEIFIAEHSIKPAENIGEKITKAITECDLFVVFWSENARDSGWVSQEIGQAKAQNKKILPLALTEGLSPSGFIDNIKYIPVYKDNENALKQATEIALEAYNNKLSSIAKTKQKDNESLVLLGIGAALLWLTSK